MKNEVRLIMIDLLGHVIFKAATKKEVFEYVFKKEYNKDNNSKTLMFSGFLNHKYIVFREDKPQKLVDQLRKLILVVSKDKTKILGSYPSIAEAKKDKELDLYTSRHVLGKLLKSGKMVPADKIYLITGNDAFELMKSLGYLDEVFELIDTDEIK